MTSIDFGSFINRNSLRFTFPWLRDAFGLDIRARLSYFDSWPIGICAWLITSLDLYSVIN